ncbi:MAG TPA: hypothetical protein GX692_08105 [Acholeplasmataceae bacterium]|nr:hypothetical protein [Acholeplasmataceae bacterium]
MNKALSYMIIGALGSSAVLLYLNNRETINNKMKKLKREGLNRIKKIKATTIE